MTVSLAPPSSLLLVFQSVTGSSHFRRTQLETSWQTVKHLASLFLNSLRSWRRPKQLKRVWNWTSSRLVDRRINPNGSSIYIYVAPYLLDVSIGKCLPENSPYQFTKVQVHINEVQFQSNADTHTAFNLEFQPLDVVLCKNQVTIYVYSHIKEVIIFLQVTLCVLKVQYVRSGPLLNPYSQQIEAYHQSDCQLLLSLFFILLNNNYNYQIISHSGM